MPKESLTIAAYHGGLGYRIPRDLQEVKQEVGTACRGADSAIEPLLKGQGLPSSKYTSALPVGAPQTGDISTAIGAAGVIAAPSTPPRIAPEPQPGTPVKLGDSGLASSASLRLPELTQTVSSAL